MKRVFLPLAILIVLGMLIGCAVPLPAQQVSPAVMEYPDAAKSPHTDGHFDLTNEMLTPLFATFEAKSFTIDTAGVAHFTPLSEHVHLRMSTTSMRLGPKQRRTVYYTVTADTYPAWFCIYSTLAGLPKRNGMNVQLDLPHTVYLLTKSRPAAGELQFSNLVLSSGHLHGTLRNGSTSFARVLSLEMSGDHLKKSEGGFPVLPGGERDFDLAVDEGKTVKHLKARLNGLQVDGIVP